MTFETCLRNIGAALAATGCPCLMRIARTPSASSPSTTRRAGDELACRDEQVIAARSGTPAFLIRRNSRVRVAVAVSPFRSDSGSNLSIKIAPGRQYWSFGRTASGALSAGGAFLVVGAQLTPA